MRIILCTLTLLVCVSITVAAQPAPRYLPPAPGAAVAVVAAHPRLVFRAPPTNGVDRTFEQLRALYHSDAAFRAIFDKGLATVDSSKEPARFAACWAVTGDDRYARAAVDLLLHEPISPTVPGDYSDIWSFALAWDWLFHHPLMEGGVRETIAKRIADSLTRELANLDDGGMATWHGRNQAANGAVVAALAVGDLPGQDANLQRAAAHYADTLRALDFFEGWPEGPSYWIHNRAAPFGVAADCFITATGADRIASLDIRAIMRKIGLWTLYQYAPDGVFEPYGDAGYSLPLGRLGYWESPPTTSPKSPATRRSRPAPTTSACARPTPMANARCTGTSPWPTILPPAPLWATTPRILNFICASICRSR